MIRTLQTRAGLLKLPAFFPDATYGNIRSCGNEDVYASGLDGVEMNSFHISSRPGTGIVKAAGGLHGFTGYNGIILTDSGGFQVFSMINENPAYGEIRDNEIVFRPDMGQEKVIYTPEKSIQNQYRLGSDIMMALDLCTAPSAPRSVQERSVELTIKWGRRCREEYDRLFRKSDNRPLLFGIIQGGAEKDLRDRCGRELEEIGFDGYGFGGWPLDEKGALREDVLQMCADAMPDTKLKYAMGLGKPEEIVRLVRMGYRLFDCVIPTREARHQRLYVFKPKMAQRDALDGGKFYSHMYIMDDMYARDFRPLDEQCDCPFCRKHSRAYLHHLFKTDDPSALRWASVHNLRFYGRLMELLREE